MCKTQTCNSFIFELCNWEAVWKCCRRAQKWKNNNGAESDDNKVDLSDAAMPSPNWKNTITAFSRGYIIVQLSWKKDPILWSSEVSKKALNACAALGMMLENCC